MARFLFFKPKVSLPCFLRVTSSYLTFSSVCLHEYNIISISLPGKKQTRHKVSVVAKAVSKECIPASQSFFVVVLSQWDLSLDVHTDTASDSSTITGSSSRWRRHARRKAPSTAARTELSQQKHIRAGEMEEAYSELYQQFLQLRSLCLRQAALLHKLTTALQKQQGATVPNGELSDMMSIPVQCTQEIPTFLLEKPQSLTAAAHGPAAQCGADRLCGNVGAFSDLLAEDMSKLCVDGPDQRKENQEMVQNIKPMFNLDSLKWQGGLSGVSKNVPQADHHSRDRTMPTARMSAPSCLVDDFRSQSDGMLMSDVALQSHVCDFCQAVFPGDTTTRGDFLRHLHTHVT